MPHLKTSALLVVLSLVAGSAAAQPSSARKSFSERIALLGIPWGDDEPEEQRTRRAPNAQVPSAPAQTQRVQRRPAAEEPRGYGIVHRLPGLDPRDLLPDEFFGGSSDPDSATIADGRGPSGAGGVRAGRSSMGATRSRVLRDLRSSAEPHVATRAAPDDSPHVASESSQGGMFNPFAQTDAAEAPPESSPIQPMVLPRPNMARVGSVLSAAPPRHAPESAPPDPSDVPDSSAEAARGRSMASAPGVRRDLLGPLSLVNRGDPPARANADVAKSVAAAVAKSMSADQAKPATAPTPAPDPTPAEPQVASKAPVSPDADAETTAPESTEAARNSNPAPPPSGGPLVMGGAPSEPDRAGPDLPQDDARWQKSTEQKSKPSPQDDRAQTSGAMAFEGSPSTPAADDPQPQDVASPAPHFASSPRAAAASDATLLMSQKMPLIVSRVTGPKQIVIGREARYRVMIANRGEVTANQLVARVQLPAWAEVEGSASSVGVVDPPVTEGDSTAVLWRMAELRPGNTQQLDLRLVAREGKPIELGVNWKHAPVGSRTVVEVQEPKLNLSIDGPDDVLFGTPEQYRLNLSNPGTGTAENVVVLLLPPNGEASDATSYTVGDLAPNESRTLKVQLTAREAGRLSIQARAAAAGNLDVGADKPVFCRRPELEVDWRGPTRRYAGVDATYYFRVRNPGTATAESVEFRVDPPKGFAVTKASGGAKKEKDGGQLVWRVGSLRPGDDYYMELHGVLHEAGANQFTLSAETSDSLATARAAMATEVIALADLKLEVRDPKGPAPVGEDVVYEVRVTNRGANTARAIDIAGLFSQGIEPYAVDGCEYSIADGRVSIRTVDRLDVGDDLVIKIHAKAQTAGTHVFRAEVVCRDLDIKLAAEETTRFYVEERISLGDRESQFK